MEPMLVNSLPIYWGNKQVGLDFNRSSFIDASDYPSLEALVERIVELDINDDEYLSILSESWLNTIYLDWKEKLLAFFDQIFSKLWNKQKYLVPYGYGNIYRNNLCSMLRNPKKKETKKVCPASLA